MRDFWRAWNIPVQKFFRTHIYIPLLRFGFSKFHATVVVYFISGLGHEYLLIPFQTTFGLFLVWFLIQPFFDGSLIKKPKSSFINSYTSIIFMFVLKNCSLYNFSHFLLTLKWSRG